METVIIAHFVSQDIRSLSLLIVNYAQETVILVLEAMVLLYVHNAKLVSISHQTLNPVYNVLKVVVSALVPTLVPLVNPTTILTHRALVHNAQLEVVLFVLIMYE